MTDFLGEVVLNETLLEITPELLKKTIIKQNKEIERLNNIIKELEKYSEKKIKEYSKKIEELDSKDKISMLCVRSAYRDISNKIKILDKGE